MGLELVAGYLIAWVVQKARRVAGRANAEVDQALDVGLDRLHALVAEKLGEEPALARLEEQATGDGVVSDRTRQRVTLALEEAAESDGEFAGRLAALLDELASSSAGGPPSAGDHGVAVAGNMEIKASDQAVAASVVHGSVTTGNPPSPGPAPA